MEMSGKLGIQLPQDGQPLPVEAQNQIAQSAAEATKQMIEQAKQALAQQQQPQPDPTQLVIQDMKQRADYDQAKLANDAKKIELEAEKIHNDRKVDLELEKIRLKEKEIDANIQFKQQELASKEASDKLSKSVELLKEEMKAGVQPSVPISLEE
jgi:uncharacterized protein YjdB